MKINEILVEQDLDEIDRRGFLKTLGKGAAAAAATGLGVGAAKDAAADEMDAPPANMIINDIPSTFVPGNDPRSIPPPNAITYMPPIIVGWPAPFWWINRWWYPPRRQQFLNWTPYYWRGHSEFRAPGFHQQAPVHHHSPRVHQQAPVHRPSAPVPVRHKE